MKKLQFAHCLTLLGIGLCAWGLALAQDSKPNIIFIMADDLGNADLGYRGGEIKTPNIDKLANEGVRRKKGLGLVFCP